VQHGKAVPFLGDRADIVGELGGERQHGRAVGARQRALADDDERALGVLQERMEADAAFGQPRQRLGPRAQRLVFVAQVGGLADDADRQVGLQPLLADAGVEHRRLEARVGTDDQDRVGILDAFDGRVEDVAGAPIGRVERGAVLSAVDIGGAERGHQAFQRIHLLDRGEVAGDGADPVAARR
jgi:hypothetical protein